MQGLSNNVLVAAASASNVAIRKLQEQGRVLYSDPRRPVLTGVYQYIFSDPSIRDNLQIAKVRLRWDIGALGRKRRNSILRGVRHPALAVVLLCNV